MNVLNLYTMWLRGNKERFVECLVGRGTKPALATLAHLSVYMRPEEMEELAVLLEPGDDV